MRSLPAAIKRHRRALLLGLALLVAAYLLPPLPAEYTNLQANSALLLTDRNGTPWRSRLSPREGVNRWVPLEAMPPQLLDCLLAAEDRRFFYHPGFDPQAMARAAAINLRKGRVVSGASTITQQLLRTLSEPKERSLGNKLKEIYWATRLELRYSKKEILEAYLNRVAFGPAVYGAEEAARYYFDKPCASLSLAECAVLAVTVRSPSVLDPFSYGAEEELKKWTTPLLQNLRREGKISEEQLQRALTQPLELSTKAPPFQASHFCDYLLKRSDDLRGEVRTTLDLPLQKSVEGMVRTHLALLSEHNVNNAAVIVAEVDTGQIRAMVGSAGYHRRRDGQHNAAISLRQPGSTLKPFTYALLLQRTGQAGFILPDLNLYENSEQESFIPKNYDNHFHGPVSIRTALACSYNVPAVRALERVGVNNLLELLQRLGFRDLDQTPDHYGLGLTLGDGSCSLLQLVSAYRTLARGGISGELQTLPGSTPELGERVLDPRTAHLLSDVLSDRRARIASFGTPNSLEFPFPVAVKTGTSKGYRDNWAVGYTPKFVVGVWVGNSDGSPMTDVSGITGAGPLFRDVMLALGDGGDFVAPKGLNTRSICTLSGDPANELCPTTVSELCFEEVAYSECRVCRRSEGGLVYDLPSLYLPWARERGLPLPPSPRQDDKLRFTFPLDQDVFQLDPDVQRDYQRVKFRVAGGTPPYRWSIDEGNSAETVEGSLWWPLRSGTHRITVLDSTGNSQGISVSVVD